MNAESAALEAATIRQQCKVLRLQSIAAQCAQLAEQAVRERRTHLGYLEALLQTELEDREQRLIERRIREARLPRMKTLEEFDFARNPGAPQSSCTRARRAGPRGAGLTVVEQKPRANGRRSSGRRAGWRLHSPGHRDNFSAVSRPRAP